MSVLSTVFKETVRVWRARRGLPAPPASTQTGVPTYDYVIKTVDNTDNNNKT
jgi:hypothetical protein